MFELVVQGPWTVTLLDWLLDLGRMHLASGKCCMCDCQPTTHFITSYLATFLSSFVGEKAVRALDDEQLIRRPTVYDLLIMLSYWV